MTTRKAGIDSLPRRISLLRRFSFRRSDHDISQLTPITDSVVSESEAPAWAPMRVKPRRSTTHRHSDPDVSERAAKISFRRSDPDLSDNSVSFDQHPTRRHSTGAAETSSRVILDTTVIRAAEERKNAFLGSLPQSLISAHNSRDCVAPLKREEIVLGPKLGEGEFSNVFEIESFELHPDIAQDGSLSDKELKQRLHMKNSEKYRSTGKSRYALKHIKEIYHQENSTEMYAQAAGDLAFEAELLGSLVHPNIIKLRGISYGGANGFSQGPSGYYLIIDRLFETLDKRIIRWHGSWKKSTPKRASGTILTTLFKKESKIAKQNNTDENGGMEEQLGVALQISAALKYLHSHAIIFRDLKPANIGFDVRGDVKIFDFGLSRIMPECDAPYVDEFEMSGAGTPRYMAPEILNYEAYNMKADVYTFAIVMWEILTGETPYGYVRSKQHLIRQILVEKVRPAIDERWPDTIKGMLESSFDSELGKRPKMAMWFDIIRDNIASLRGGDYSKLGSSYVARRRSIESSCSRT